MIVYLIRHAKAEDSNPQGDRYRELSAKGVARIRSLFPGLKEKGFSPGVWISSPYTRAKQTAHYFSEAFAQPKNFELSSTFTPDGDVHEAVDEISHIVSETGQDSVAVFTHNPFVSELAMALLDNQSFPNSHITFHTPTVLALDFPHGLELRKGRFLWLLHPSDHP